MCLQNVSRTCTLRCKNLFGYVSRLIYCAIFFSYINYSNIAAKLVRRALKPEFRTEAARREDSSIRFIPWKDGKAQSKFI